ncbi:putative aldouronate transport system permease protein [Gracilibacillus orientalis]|uniref:Putative aldouronate transport system permease protein n=1 Tax=Gracilibacillus orientalis TaxID=334253 RepID=A0A1I4LQR6_9BACI|nr:ABC transporter permease subunit [Gracilibacillus orientalis]SFL93231.1 putative aldouronate transport system permease protein [Gracilibacillus orientalis]
MDESLEQSKEIKKVTQWHLAKRSFQRHWQLYILMMLPVLYFIIFKYVPMLGAVIAFKDYNVVQGIIESPWVGWKHFENFFNNPVAWDLIKNTLFLSLYQLAVTFPLPILLALALNEIRDGIFKRFVQMFTYAPYFISTVVIVSMIILMLSPRTGIVNNLMEAVGLDAVNFLGQTEMFRSIFVWSDAWQITGYSAIIYLAALAGVDKQQYEAAKIDGASRLQKIWNVDIPAIMPTIVIILILSVGNLMAIGFEKVYLLQNPLNLGTSEILQTYVYKMGIINADFSFATAVGFFNSIINLILLIIVNAIAKKVSGNGLW